MARATPKSASNGAHDAITLLKKDHQIVEALFEEFEEKKEEEGQAIAQRVCQLLTVHAQIEEEILYPAAKKALADDEETCELVPEAAVEHATAKDLIAKIEAMEEQDEEFNATVKVLSEYIKHHVKEEEGELFPALKKTELDLKEIGAQLQQRKEELMNEMGIADEDEEGATHVRRAHRTVGSGNKARRHTHS